MIKAAASRHKATVVRADTFSSGQTIIEALQSAIREASLVIADLSDANPNVMYEVGFAQAAKKPLIGIAGNLRTVPFDIATTRILVYDPATPSEFVDRLAEAIDEAIKTPSAFSPARAIREREKRNKVFISYSHEDRYFLDRLLVHLKPLEKQGVIDLWVDTRLRAGDQWRKEIERSLDRANVAILLVSADFLASDFITDDELPPLLRAAEERGTRIIPVILKPCRFARDPNLKHFQSLNDPHSSVATVPVAEQEAIYDQVAAEIERAMR